MKNTARKLTALILAAIMLLCASLALAETKITVNGTVKFLESFV